MIDKVESMWERRCVLCGEPSGDGLTDGVMDWFFPGYCSKHADEVLQELEHNHSMYPKDWFGHSSRDAEGYYQDSDPRDPAPDPCADCPPFEDLEDRDAWDNGMAIPGESLGGSS